MHPDSSYQPGGKSPSSPEVFAGVQLFSVIHSFVEGQGRGIIPSLDSNGPWKPRLLSKTAKNADKSQLDYIDGLLKENQLRVRVNPAVAGKRWASLKSTSLLLEIYFANGDPARGVAIDSLDAPIPPIDTPLGKDGYPEFLRVRYRDFGGRRYGLIGLQGFEKANELHISETEDRLWIMSQLSERTYKGWGFTYYKTCLEISFRDGRRYLVDAEGGMRTPDGKEFGLSPRAFMLLSQFLAKYANSKAQPGAHSR